MVRGGCQKADKVHRGHHTRQELPLVVSRNPADVHRELQMDEDEDSCVRADLKGELWGMESVPFLIALNPSGDISVKVV